MTSRGTTIAGAAAGTVAFVAAGTLLRSTPLVDAQLALLGAAVGVTVPIDLHEHRIPNRIVLPAIVASAPLAALAGTSSRTVLAGIGLVVLMLVLALAAPAALGMGDVKLALLLAVALDARAPNAILASLTLAALYGLLLLARHGRAAGQTAIPLAPFFACGALLGVVA